LCPSGRLLRAYLLLRALLAGDIADEELPTHILIDEADRGHLLRREMHPFFRLRGEQTPMAHTALGSQRHRVTRDNTSCRAAAPWRPRYRALCASDPPLAPHTRHATTWCGGR